MSTQDFVSVRVHAGCDSPTGTRSCLSLVRGFERSWPQWVVCRQCVVALVVAILWVARQSRPRWSGTGFRLAGTMRVDVVCEVTVSRVVQQVRPRQAPRPSRRASAAMTSAAAGPARHQPRVTLARSPMSGGGQAVPSRPRKELQTSSPPGGGGLGMASSRRSSRELPVSCRQASGVCPAVPAAVGAQCSPPWDEQGSTGGRR